MSEPSWIDRAIEAGPKLYRSPRRAAHTPSDDTAIEAAMAERVANAGRWLDECFERIKQAPADPRLWQAFKAAWRGYQAVRFDAEEA